MRGFAALVLEQFTVQVWRIAEKVVMPGFAALEKGDVVMPGFAALRVPSVLLKWLIRSIPCANLEFEGLPDAPLSHTGLFSEN